VLEGTSLNGSDPGNLRERNVRTVGECFARLEAMDIDGFVGLWAEDGVQEMPFARKRWDIFSPISLLFLSYSYLCST
jgi:hypothetical protein